MTAKKRSFTPEYNAESGGLVLDGEKSISAVARDLGLSESALRRWVVQSETDAGRSDTKELTTPERAELAQLRRDNRQLRMEREILKKATAFFAKESWRPNRNRLLTCPCVLRKRCACPSERNPRIRLSCSRGVHGRAPPDCSRIGRGSAQRKASRYALQRRNCEACPWLSRTVLRFETAEIWDKKRLAARVSLRLCTRVSGGNRYPR
jgi:transposase